MSSISLYDMRMKKLHCLGIMLALLLALCPLRDAFAQEKKDYFVLLRTTSGLILMRIYYSMVPYTAGNFLNLVNRGFYDGLSFHRVEDWVIQGGDPNGNGTGDFVDPDTGRTRYLKLQTHPNLTHNQAGMVAMARSSDPNSASCQFYILKRPMPQLNGQYAVFGKVIKGMGSVQSIHRGDVIKSARIVNPETLEPIEVGGNASGGGSPQQAVPGVAEPPAPSRPAAQPGTGDAGF